MMSWKLTDTFAPLPPFWANATIAWITLLSERFGGATGASAAGWVAAAADLGDRATPGWLTVAAPVLRGLSPAVTVGSEVDVVSLALVLGRRAPTLPPALNSGWVVEPGLLVGPVRALPVPGRFGGVERPALPRVGFVVPGVDVVDWPALESAWATPVATLSDAQTPTARALAPSQADTLLGCCCARWRAIMRGASGLARLSARCRARMESPMFADV